MQSQRATGNLFSRAELPRHPIRKTVSVSDFVAVIKDRIRETHMSMVELSYLSGIKRSTLTRKLRKSDFALSELLAVMDVLTIDPTCVLLAVEHTDDYRLHDSTIISFSVQLARLLPKEIYTATSSEICAFSHETVRAIAADIAGKIATNEAETQRRREALLTNEFPPRTRRQNYQSV